MDSFRIYSLVAAGGAVALAAFALFAAGFAVLAVLVSSIYMLQKVWEVGVARMAERRSPAASMARRAAAAMEELGSRPYRRPV